MDPLHVFGALAAMVATAVGATWALRSKLGDIEQAIHGHIETDLVTHKDQEARIIKLEQRRRR